MTLKVSESCREELHLAGSAHALDTAELLKSNRLALSAGCRVNSKFMDLSVFLLST